MGLFGGLSGGGGGGGLGGGGSSGGGGGGFGGFGGGGGGMPFLDPFMLINMLLGDPLGIMGGDEEAGAESTGPAPSTDPLDASGGSLPGPGEGDNSQIIIDLLIEQLVKGQAGSGGGGGQPRRRQQRPVGGASGGI